MYSLMSLYLLHHVKGQMHMCLIASFVKIINKSNALSCTTQVNQDGFMLRLICIFLGCDLAIQLLPKSLSSPYEDRLVDHFHNVMHNYKINITVCEILCLNK